MGTKDRLTITVECKMDDIEAMIKEIKELPVYEGIADKPLVERDALIEIFKRHLEAEAKK